MAFAAKNQRPPFESDFDDMGAYEIDSGPGPKLPPVEFKVEDIADSASPEEIIRAAMEDRAIETTLGADVSFGPVVVPAEKTLYGYKYALSSSGHDIRFSHEKYGIFDGILAAECGVDEGGNPTHGAFNPRLEYYTHYSPLRRNIAILRNYLMGLYPPAKDKVNQATLRAMAKTLGKALHSEPQKLSFFERILWAIRRIFMKGAAIPNSNRFIALANTPDRGISFMYNYLCVHQAEPGFIDLPASQLPKNWKLLPLEETPFSAENIVQYSDASRMGLIATALELVTKHLNSVDDMTPKDKEISVDHARDILKNLRILMTGQQEEKQYDEMDPRCREAQNMLCAALGFQSALADMARNNPDLLNDPLVLEASKAIGKIHSRVKGEGQEMAKEEKRAEPTTTASPTEKPQEKKKSSKAKADKKPKESIHKLMFKFEEGINRASEIRRKNVARAKERVLHNEGKQGAVKEAMGKSKTAMPKALQEGQSIMSSPKIHQVNVSDPDFIEVVKKMNEEREIEQKKAPPGGQSLGGK